MNTDRYVIWSFNDINLTKLKEELSKDQYDKPIKYTKNGNGGFDDYYRNRWINESGNQNFEIYEENLTENPKSRVKFIYAKALFESGYGPSRAQANGELLPREARVFNHEVDACFFEKNELVYVVLKINSSLEGKMRASMFSFLNNEGKKAAKPKHHNIPHYWMTSDFYYWILYKSVQRESSGDNNITFYNISSLNQKDQLKAYDSQNEGNNVLDFTNVLSGLGEKQDISKIKIGINVDSSHIMLEMNSNCNFEVNTDTLRLGHRISNNTFSNVALYLYLYLVPKLFSEYNHEKSNESWNDTVSETSRKEWAFSAIANLLLANDIEIGEIEEYLDENELI